MLLRSGRKPANMKGMVKTLMGKGGKAAGKKLRAAGPGYGLWLPAILGLLVAAAYANSLSAPFVLDDFRSIVENASIRSISPEILTPAPGTGLFLRPLTNLSFAINYATGKLSPFGYHLVNIALHLIAALLLLALMRQSARAAGAGPLTGAACAAAAFLWALHPLGTAAVTNVAERATVLWVLFLWASLYFLGRARSGGRPRRWETACAASFFLALCSKQDAVAIAPILLLYDAVFFSGGVREALKENRGFYALVFCLGLGAGLAFLAGGGVPALGQESVSAFSYLSRQPAAVCRYLRLCLWPAGLTLDYGPLAPGEAKSIACAALLLVLAGLSAWGLYRRSWWGFCGGLFFLALVPSSSVYPLSTELAEHRAYAPLAAVMALAAVLPAAAMQGARRLPGILPAAALALVLALFFAATVARNRDYRSSQAIWEDTLDKAPENVNAMMGLADALRASGRDPEAAIFYMKAIRQVPDFFPARHNLANLYLAQESPDQALVQLRAALALAPSSAKVLNGMGQAMLMKGDPEQAAALFRQALDRDPENVAAAANLGAALMAQELYEEAARQLKQALFLAPDLVRARVNLGVCFLAMGKPRRAKEELIQALEMEPGNEAARKNLLQASRALEED